MGLLVDQTFINQYDNKGEKHGKWITFFSNYQIRNTNFQFFLGQALPDQG